jgi:hypothetical protein
MATKRQPAATKPRTKQQDIAERALELKRETELKRVNGYDDDADSLAGDLLRGAGEISRFLGLPLRQVRYGLGQGHIPAEKNGALYIGSKKRLRRHYQGPAAEK